MKLLVVLLVVIVPGAGICYAIHRILKAAEKRPRDPRA